LFGETLKKNYFCRPKKKNNKGKKAKE